MEYSPPAMFRSIQVTDNLKLANTDVLPTLLGLQSGLGSLATSDITLKNGTCLGITATGNITTTGDITAGASFYSVGNATFSNPVTVGTPSSAGHATTKTYVDTALGLKTDKTYTDALSYLTASTGLAKTGSTLSVNATQTQITSVGTLTSLSVSGNLTGTSATFSSPITVGTPTVSGNATTKTYVDTALGLKTDKTYTDALSYLTVGTGLTKTDAAGSGTTYSSASLLAGGYGLIVSGGLTQGVGSVAKLEMKNGGSQTAIVSVDGAGNATFSSPVTVATPTLTGHAVSKGYADTALALKTDKTYTDALSYLTAGSGLTKTGATLSVNVAQTQITSVGTLASLTVSGAATVGSLSTSGAGASSATGVLIFGDGRVRINSTSASTSTTTGAFAVSGGIGLTGDLYGANAVFSGTVTAGTPTEH